MAENRGLTGVYLSFVLDVDTPMEIVAVGENYPGRYSLRLGNLAPDVSISSNNAALARLRDLITAHLDAHGGDPS
jgi:hypothetical protein